MFSNNLVKRICINSNEADLIISPDDWKIILDANKSFTEETWEHRGSKLWGRYLLNKLSITTLDLKNSVELCSGNGFLYFSLKDFCNFSENSYFFDISKNQCDAFKQRLNNSDFLNIACQDIGNLPFTNNQVEIVYGNSFLHHLPDVKKYLEEAYRVTKENGKLIIFHEPTSTASFFESFPISLLKDTRADSLTDIWSININVIKKILREIGYREVKIYPSGILSSILITPFQIILRKLKFYSVADSEKVSSLKYYLDKLERLILPTKLLEKYGPSISIFATK